MASYQVIFLQRATHGMSSVAFGGVRFYGCHGLIANQQTSQELPISIFSEATYMQLGVAQIGH